jgi:hypothetical protein
MNFASVTADLLQSQLILLIEPCLTSGVTYSQFKSLALIFVEFKSKAKVDTKLDILKIFHITTLFTKLIAIHGIA